MNLVKKSLNQILFVLLTTLLLNSCAEEVQQSLKSVPLAYGNLNQVVVLADKDLWEGPLGDTLVYYYSSAFPILPQPEPLFDLKHIEPAQLAKEPALKNLRCFLILDNLNDTDSPTTQWVIKDIGKEKARRAQEDPGFYSLSAKDKYAKNQLLIYQFAHSEDALIENLKKSFNAVTQKIHDAGKHIIDATVFQAGESQKLKQEIRDKMGAEIRIPADYVLAISDEEVIWVRKETRKISSNLMFKKIKYLDQSQLTKAKIKSIRDSLGRKYVSSSEPGSYMRINDKDLPMFSWVKSINNNYAIEARGIWELEHDFMGGPFVSYLIHNSQKGELLFVDGFLHAPGEEKREYMQELEYIISSVEF